MGTCYTEHESGLLPPGFVPFERESTKREARERARSIRDGTFLEAKGELPQGDTAKPAKEVVLPKSKKKQVEQRGLF